MTEKDIEKYKQIIDKMSHFECAHHWRFAPSGDVIMQNDILFDYFEKHFKKLGGFTPAISKRVGW